MNLSAINKRLKTLEARTGVGEKRFTAIEYAVTAPDGRVIEVITRPIKWKGK